MKTILQKYGRAVPVFFILSLIPLLVRMHAYDPGLSAYSWYPAGESVSYDFFLYFKAVSVCLVSLIMLSLLLRDLFSDTAPEDIKDAVRQTLPLILYFLFVLLSGLFSKERRFAFLGTMEVFEPVPVLLSYGILFWYGFHVCREEGSIRRFLASGSMGAVCLCLTCFLQFLNRDPFRQEAVKRLITPASFHESLSSLAFTFPDHIAYGSFYNTNQLIQYFCFLIPICLALLFWKPSRLPLKAFCGSLALFSILALASAYSKTGLVVMLITGLFSLSFFLRTKRDLVRIGLPALAVLSCLLLFFALRFEGFGSLLRRFAGEKEASAARRITAFSTLKDSVLLTIDGSDLSIAFEDNQDGTISLTLTDEAGNELEEYPGLSCIPVIFHDRVCLDLRADGIELTVTKDPAAGYLYYAPSGKWVSAHAMERASFFPEDFLTGRGRLWNNILPRLKSVLLLGRGANCFLFFYPQDDWLQKAYAGEETMLDVKAHSLYLQQFTENGALALLAFLAALLHYLLQSFRLYRRKDVLDRSSLLSLTGFAIFLGIAAYLLSGFTVDSSVCTAPVFWLLFGAGQAINRLLR